MAGKHYGGQLVYNANNPRTQVYPGGRLNKAFMEGWSGEPNKWNASTEVPEFTAWQNGANMAGANPPQNEGAGRKWETAG